MLRSESLWERTTIPDWHSFSVSSLCVIVLESFYKFSNQNFKAVRLNLPSQKNVSGKKSSNFAANVTFQVLVETLKVNLSANFKPARPNLFL